MMRTGLIGNGYWGKIIKPKLEELTDLKFVADSKSDIIKLISNVDWVFVCTPTDTHYDIVKMCLEHDKNVFCEKPFTGNLICAKKLFNLARKSNKKIYINNLFLFRTEYSSIVENNYTIHHITFTWNKSGNVKDDIYNSWLYHDIYMLLNISLVYNWRVISKYTDDIILKLTIVNDKKNIIVNFCYDRNSKLMEKRVIINHEHIYDFTTPMTDPLYDTINMVKSGMVDYEDNRRLTLKTLKILTCVERVENGERC